MKFRKVVGSTEEYAARLATALQTPGKMQTEWLENDQGQLVLPQASPVIIEAQLDSAGRVRANNGSGQLPVVEASAATIATNLQRTPDAVAECMAATIEDSKTTYSGNQSKLRHRKAVVTLAAADGSGLVAATPLVTSAGAYYPVLDGLRLWSTVADTFTANFTCATGTLVGPAALSYTTVASVVNTATEKGLWYNLTDASTIQIDIAAATVGMVIHCIVDYHFET